jgi:dTDP-4-dehydrorhamnose reductase
MTFSSDLVFDGTKGMPYIESDAVNPLNVYGKSKAAAEMAVSAINSDSIIIRTSAFFGPWDEYNFVHYVVRELSAGRSIRASSDIIAPTYVPHLVNAALDLLIDKESGIWHLSNNTAVSWKEFALWFADRLGLDYSLILDPLDPLPAERPAYSVLNSSKGILMPDLHVAVESYIREAPVCRQLVQSEI